MTCSVHLKHAHTLPQTAASSIPLFLPWSETNSEKIISYLEDWEGRIDYQKIWQHCQQKPGLTLSDLLGLIKDYGANSPRFLMEEFTALCHFCALLMPSRPWLIAQLKEFRQKATGIERMSYNYVLSNFLSAIDWTELIKQDLILWEQRAINYDATVGELGDFAVQQIFPFLSQTKKIEWLNFCVQCSSPLANFFCLPQTDLVNLWSKLPPKTQFLLKEMKLLNKQTQLYLELVNGQTLSPKKLKKVWSEGEYNDPLFQQVFLNFLKKTPDLAQLGLRPSQWGNFLLSLPPTFWQTDSQVWQKIQKYFFAPTQSFALNQFQKFLFQRRLTFLPPVLIRHFFLAAPNSAQLLDLLQQNQPSFNEQEKYLQKNLLLLCQQRILPHQNYETALIELHQAWQLDFSVRRQAVCPAEYGQGVLLNTISYWDYLAEFPFLASEFDKQWTQKPATITNYIEFFWLALKAQRPDWLALTTNVSFRPQKNVNSFPPGFWERLQQDPPAADLFLQKMETTSLGNSVTEKEAALGFLCDFPYLPPTTTDLFALPAQNRRFIKTILTLLNSQTALLLPNSFWDTWGQALQKSNLGESFNALGMNNLLSGETIKILANARLRLNQPKDNK